jgi:hypothetical protein
MNKKEKPINPFIINPENFLRLVENFITAYPTYYHRLKQLSDLGEKECNKADYRESGAKFSKDTVNFNYKLFWENYLNHSDVLYANYSTKTDIFKGTSNDPLIINGVFQHINAIDSNAIFKTSRKQGISYSLVISTVGLKVELLIKTLRKDIKDERRLRFNKIIFNEIAKHKLEINRKLKNLVWDLVGDRKYQRIYYVIRKCSINNKINLPNLPRLSIEDISGTKTNIFAEMAESVDKFYKVFSPYVQKLDIQKLEKKL